MLGEPQVGQRGGGRSQRFRGLAVGWYTSRHEDADPAAAGPAPVPARTRPGNSGDVQPGWRDDPEHGPDRDALPTEKTEDSRTVYPFRMARNLTVVLLPSGNIGPSMPVGRG